MRRVALVHVCEGCLFDGAEKRVFHSASAKSGGVYMVLTRMGRYPRHMDLGGTGALGRQESYRAKCSGSVPLIPLVRLCSQ